MRIKRPLILASILVGFLSPALAAQDATEPAEPPPHVAAWPGLAGGSSPEEIEESLALGPELHRNIPARTLLSERRKLDAALDKLQPNRRGVVDSYVVSIALDSDPVFAREAREAGKVLSRRYNANGRTLVLAGPDGDSDELAKGSINSLTIALARIAEIMDGNEDVIVLYSTSHGAPQGLAYHYGDIGFGILSPARLKSVFEELGFKRRILLISACYSGVFVPAMASEDTAILTASHANRTSFGCAAENDWTFFGDALINRALRKPQSLAAASQEANYSIANWELQKRLLASLPQTSLGANVTSWLPALEARLPPATAPVGKPAVGE